MSKTDKTAPAWVTYNRAPLFRPDHRCADYGHRRWVVASACDLPPEPFPLPEGPIRSKHRSSCTWEPAFTRGEWSRMVADHPGKQASRKLWYRQDRAAQRRIARNLAREADSGIELNEDQIDNRAHRHGARGGWWD